MGVNIKIQRSSVSRNGKIYNGYSVIIRDSISSETLHLTKTELGLLKTLIKEKLSHESK